MCISVCLRKSNPAKITLMSFSVWFAESFFRWRCCDPEIKIIFWGCRWKMLGWAGQLGMPRFVDFWSYVNGKGLPITAPKKAWRLFFHFVWISFNKKWKNWRAAFFIFLWKSFEFLFACDYATYWKFCTQIFGSKLRQSHGLQRAFYACGNDMLWHKAENPKRQT